MDGILFRLFTALCILIIFFSSCIYIQVVLSRASTAEILETGPTTPNPKFSLPLCLALSSPLRHEHNRHIYTHTRLVLSPIPRAREL